MEAKYRVSIEVKRIKGKCPVYQEGDKFVLEGNTFNLKKTTAICMMALQSYPFWCIYAKGSDSVTHYVGEINGEIEFACPMPGKPYTSCGTAVFKTKRVRLK